MGIISIVTTSYAMRVGNRKEAYRMKNLEINEIMLVILFAVGLICCIYFFVRGKKLAKKNERTEFEKVALMASITAMFLAQLTSAAGNFNIMNNVKEISKTIRNVFQDKMLFNEPVRPTENNDGINSTKDTEIQKVSPEELRKIVENDYSIIFKDDIFLVDTTVRNVTADERNNIEKKEWTKSVDAEVGDIVEYQIHYRNTTMNQSQDVMARAVSPRNMDIIGNTTKLYTTKTPDGALLNNNNDIWDVGINIGSYYPNGDAYIRFREKVVDRNLVEGTNRLVLWGQVTNWIPEHEDDNGNTIEKKGETLQSNADVYVVK